MEGAVKAEVAAAAGLRHSRAPLMAAPEDGRTPGWAGRSLKILAGFALPEVIGFSAAAFSAFLHKLGVVICSNTP